MSFLDKLKTNDSKTKDEVLEDRIGGFRLLESDIYTGKIDVACFGQSDGGAVKVHLEMTMDDGANYSEDIWISDKDGNLFYTDKQTNEKRNMKGYNIVNAICMLLTGTPLKSDDGQQEVEDRTFQLWSSAEGKKVDQSVPTLINLIGERISVGILKTRLNKNEKTDAGYKPTNDERFENSIEAVFHPEHKVTLAEAVKAAEKEETPEPVFFDKWLDANKGKLIDKFKEIKGGGKPGSMAKPSAGGGSAEPKKKMDLFAKK